MARLSKVEFATLRNRGVVCFVVLFAAFACFGAGCQSLPTIHFEETKPSSTGNTTSTWRSVATGIERREDRVAVDDVGARFIVYRFSGRAFSWRVVAPSSTTGKTMLDWAEQFPRAQLVFNAGYFHEDGLPSGFVIASGTRIGGRSFDPRRSSLLTLDPWPQISSPVSVTSVKALQAIQSYPLLISEGKSAIDKESGLYARRTFVGTDAKGDIYVGFVPYESITLFQLSRLLPKLEIPWQTVLNLDGGPSTGFVFRSPSYEERVESFTTIPYVIVVEPK